MQLGDTNMKSTTLRSENPADGKPTYHAASGALAMASVHVGIPSNKVKQPEVASPYAYYHLDWV